MYKQKQHYSNQVLTLMSAIEDEGGNRVMFHDSFPDLQTEYQQACESQGHKPMRSVYYKICKAFDSLNA